MLESEHDRFYIVYPSWADLSYKWSDLPDVMMRPSHSHFLDPDFDWRAKQFPTRVQASKLLDGAFGNGIIEANIERHEKWLPWMILLSEASFSIPAAMHKIRAPLASNVGYLDPITGLGRNVRSYVCAITPENISSDPTGVYWVVGSSSRRQSQKISTVLSTIALGFGFDIECLAEPPPPVRDETSGWFRDSSIEYTWYRASSDEKGAGFHFAVVLYAGLHRASVKAYGVRFAHLFAEIPGAPQVRRHMEHW